MNLPVEWDNPEKTIIRITYPEKWTWSDFYEANTAAVALMKTVEHPVHFLADFRQSRSALAALPDNWGILVIVSTSVLIQRLVSIFRTAFTGRMSTKTYSVTSIEEAYRVIAEQDSRTIR